MQLSENLPRPELAGTLFAQYPAHATTPSIELPEQQLCTTDGFAHYDTNYGADYPSKGSYGALVASPETVERINQSLFPSSGYILENARIRAYTRNAEPKNMHLVPRAEIHSLDNWYSKAGHPEIDTAIHWLVTEIPAADAMVSEEATSTDKYEAIERVFQVATLAEAWRSLQLQGITSQNITDIVYWQGGDMFGEAFARLAEYYLDAVPDAQKEHILFWPTQSTAEERPPVRKLLATEAWISATKMLIDVEYVPPSVPTNGETQTISPKWILEGMRYWQTITRYTSGDALGPPIGLALADHDNYRYIMADASPRMRRQLYTLGGLVVDAVHDIGHAGSQLVTRGGDQNKIHREYPALQRESSRSPLNSDKKALRTHFTRLANQLSTQEEAARAASINGDRLLKVIPATVRIVDSDEVELLGGDMITRGPSMLYCIPHENMPGNRAAVGDRYMIFHVKNSSGDQKYVIHGMVPHNL